MYLRSLELIDFKNYSEAEIPLGERVNCFVGKNGSGKTNLLDALHYLSFCKSALNPVDGQNIREGRPFFVIKGHYSDGEKEHELYCSMERNRKKRFRKDRKDYERLADHIGKFPVVLIAPFDLALVQGGSDVRRKFMDGIISQYDASYLRDLIAYNRALSQRNALLKRVGRSGNGVSEELALWEEKMAEPGERIRKAREAFIESFTPVFQEMHGRIAGSDEVLLEYRRSGEKGLTEALAEGREKDLVLGYSSIGPHREDLRFGIRGASLKKFGSQGQQKSYVLGLKLAQFRFIKDSLGIVPILLLDDLFDKLDRERAASLLELVAGEDFGQLLITDTNKERLEQSLGGLATKARFFEVEKGEIRPWDPATIDVD